MLESDERKPSLFQYRYLIYHVKNMLFMCSELLVCCILRIVFSKFVIILLHIFHAGLNKQTRQYTYITQKPFFEKFHM